MHEILQGPWPQSPPTTAMAGGLCRLYISPACYSFIQKEGHPKEGCLEGHLVELAYYPFFNIDYYIDGHQLRVIKMKKAIRVCFMIKRSVVVRTAAISLYTFVRLCVQCFIHIISVTPPNYSVTMWEILLLHITEGNRTREGNSLLSEAQTQKLSCVAKPML